MNTFLKYWNISLSTGCILQVVPDPPPVICQLKTDRKQHMNGSMSEHVLGNNVLGNNVLGNNVLGNNV